MEQKLLYVESLDAAFTFKRRLTTIAFAIRLFFLGLQHGIIVPTIWIYLKRLHASVIFLGISFAVYEITAAGTYLVVNRIFEKSRSGRKMFFVLNSFDMLGHVLYAIPSSSWLILLGRAITGIGAGFRPVIDGEISWLYLSNQRIRMFTFLEISRLLGLLCGPPVLLAITHVHFRLGHYTFDFSNSPAIVCALLSLLMQMITYGTISDLSRHYFGHHTCGKFENEADEEETSPLSNVKTNNPQTTELEIIEAFNMNVAFHCENLRTYLSCGRVVQELCALDFLSVATAVFLSTVISLSFETLALLVTLERFHWSPLTLSMLYASIGLYTMLLTTLIGSLSRLIRGELWIIVSSTTSCVGLLLLILYKVYAASISLQSLTFCTSLVFCVSSLPLCLLGSRSLLMQIVMEDKRELAQSVLSLVRRVASISAPIAVSIGFYRLNVFSTVLIFLSVVSLIWLGLAYEKLENKHRTLEEAYANQPSCDGLSVAFVR